MSWELLFVKLQLRWNHGLAGQAPAVKLPLRLALEPSRQSKEGEIQYPPFFCTGFVVLVLQEVSPDRLFVRKYPLCVPIRQGRDRAQRQGEQHQKIKYQRQPNRFHDSSSPRSM